ncbi:hypothetical protein [Bacillus weihaiensis]|uniref:WYL domain-containing protein n=1 Tax=Bacillus weihaiensis TaxID=1547283 RepID=A0A1L3MT57_9BACI|nr:hypothetical protein [Bacillus weihaiensis]APH05523.1 hypothetical protein A9C19_12600 [Bacillus weihaiensis]
MKLFLTQSLDQNKPIVIIYMSNDGDISQRKVLVKRIGNKHFIAYCYLKKQIRTFTLENTLSAGHIRYSKVV